MVPVLFAAFGLAFAGTPAEVDLENGVRATGAVPLSAEARVTLTSALPELAGHAAYLVERPFVSLDEAGLWLDEAVRLFPGDGALYVVVDHDLDGDPDRVHVQLGVDAQALGSKVSRLERPVLLDTDADRQLDRLAWTRGVAALMTETVAIR